MKEENDSIKQIEQFKLRIKQKGIIHQSLLVYLGISADEINQKTKKEEKPEGMYQILKENNIITNKCEFREYLEAISYLWENHQSKKEIKYKIESLFKILKEDMKNLFSETEIFASFRNCKNNFILMILVDQNILSIKTIIENINIIKNMKINNRNIVLYFYPEIRKYNVKYYNELMKNNEVKQFVEENDQNLDLFYKTREEGKKEPKIIELIREDKIEDFISFVEHSSIDLNIEIENLTPIEYSALFGSIRVFRYLYIKEVNINVVVKYDKNNIIEYAVQGRNYEIIHLLEERKEIIENLNNLENQHKYLEFSIKMHYNEIFEYFMANYNIQITAENIKLMIISRNYQLFDQLIERNQIEFKDKTMITNVFHGICQNGNEEIVKMLINQPNLDINIKNDIY